MEDERVEEEEGTSGAVRWLDLCVVLLLCADDLIEDREEEEEDVAGGLMSDRVVLRRRLEGFSDGEAEEGWLEEEEEVEEEEEEEEEEGETRFLIAVLLLLTEGGVRALGFGVDLDADVVGAIADFWDALGMVRDTAGFLGAAGWGAVDLVGATGDFLDGRTEPFRGGGAVDFRDGRTAGLAGWFGVDLVWVPLGIFREGSLDSVSDADEFDRAERLELEGLLEEDRGFIEDESNDDFLDCIFFFIIIFILFCIFFFY